MTATDHREAAWFTSSRSGNNGSCVEVAFVADAVATRDSKDRSGPVLTVAPDAWQAFVTTVKNQHV